MVGKEIIYITPDLHTGHIREASYELLDASLQIIRRLERTIEEYAYTDPGAITLGLIQFIINPASLPGRVQMRWDKSEAWVQRFLCTTRVIRNPQHLDERLDILLPSLDPRDPDSAEGFLFGSRERINFLLSEKGIRLLDSLNYGSHAYIESLVLRKALTKGVFLTQASAD